ncbi:L-ectoine synthase [Bradyrhizobium sp. USDA 4512]
MIVRQLRDIRKTDRLVKSKGWDSARLLLKSDGMGFSFHITTMYAGEELKMHYQNHLEAVFILKGTGTIEDLGTGETHKLAPGIMYALNKNDQHIVRPGHRPPDGLRVQPAGHRPGSARRDWCLSD